eukprot:gb/GFBE01065713.1/.p1 GENE.gb/GFBE01065713.1/~~gb/GFBE01065713.1/.p1  ORF type:complete len:352 (+),score=70.51 gb/GFBE01065713.1/:1-1056(+)
MAGPPLRRRPIVRLPSAAVPRRCVEDALRRRGQWPHDQDAEDKVLSGSAKTASASSSFSDFTVSEDGRYQFEKVIGEGGFATIRRARCLRSGKSCAVKSLLKENAYSRAAALQEAEDLRRVSGHPGVCKLIEVVEDDFCIHLVLEHIQGRELLEEINDQECMEEGHAAEILEQVLQALAHCHSRGVVHQDCKPENIMVYRFAPVTPQAPRNAGPRKYPFVVTLIDFGMAALQGKPRKILEGTQAYIAPEVLAGRTMTSEFSQDIWSTGVVLFAMLVGTLPPDAVAGAAAAALVAAEVADVSLDAGAFLALLLTLDPKERPSAKQALCHPWLTSQDCTVPLSPPGTSVVVSL